MYLRIETYRDDLRNALKETSIFESNDCGICRYIGKKGGVSCIVRNPNKNEKKEHTPIEYAVLDSTKLEQFG